MRILYLSGGGLHYLSAGTSALVLLGAAYGLLRLLVDATRAVWRLVLAHPLARPRQHVAPQRDRWHPPEDG